MSNGSRKASLSAQKQNKQGSLSNPSHLKKITVDLSLIVAAALLFSSAFPNPVNHYGFGFLGFVALLPLPLLVRRASWRMIAPYGFVYGFLTYSLFNYWLLNFHPLAIFIVPVIYAVYFTALFPALKLADRAFPRYGFLVQLCFWLAYEYLRTQFFLGYPYGILGYSQFMVSPLVRVSGLVGIWGVSALVVYPGVYLGRAFFSGLTQPHKRIAVLLRSRPLPALAYLGVLAVALLYGFVSLVDYSEARHVRAAMVQQNVDPWEGGLQAYRASLNASLRQSSAALADDPDIDIVIWSETSFVPAIAYHTRYRERQESYELVRELVGYLEQQDVPFVLGNGDGRMARNEQGALVREDYNAALLFNDGEFTDVYHKIHLVPFTEHFPYRDTLPWLHGLLVANDTTFWQAGDEYTVFEAAGMAFATPICFEDSFGYLTRNFVNAGAEVIVNLTNDSWAHSVPSAMQHMAMAVFRAGETRRSVVRGTNGGMTSVIDPNGEIVAVYPAFVEGYLIADVPVYTEQGTLYLRIGDTVAVILTFFAFVLLVFCGIRTALDKSQAND
jgi:apolipoprotein N-acyltransferase